MNGTKIAAIAVAPLLVLVTIMIVILGGAEAQQDAAAATCPATPPANNPTTTTTAPSASSTGATTTTAPASGATSSTTAPASPPASTTATSPAAGSGGYQVLDASPSNAPTIMGPNTLNANQLTAWYGLNHTQAVNGVPIAQVIALYLSDGQTEGVRGDLAFVQAIHETGWFTNSDTAINNFAGIGHPVSAASGIPFGGVGIGVLAHMQLLKEAAEGNNVAMALPKVAPAWGSQQVASINSGGGTGTTQATVLTATEIQPGDVNLDVSISEAGTTTQQAWTVQLVTDGVCNHNGVTTQGARVHVRARKEW